MDKVTVRQRDFQKDPQKQLLNQKTDQQQLSAIRLREKGKITNDYCDAWRSVNMCLRESLYHGYGRHSKWTGIWGPKCFIKHVLIVCTGSRRVKARSCSWSRSWLRNIWNRHMTTERTISDKSHRHTCVSLHNFDNMHCSLPLTTADIWLISKSSWSALSCTTPTLLEKYWSNAPCSLLLVGAALDPSSPFLAGMAGGLASWKSLNMSFPVFFSLSPRGSKAVKALFSILGAASLPGGLGGGRDGPGWKGLVDWPQPGAAAGGWQKMWGGDKGGANWDGIGWPQAVGGMGRPPKADGCG